MAKERDLALYVAIYENVDSAETDLNAIEQLHKEELIGTFDAAVVDKEKGRPHIVKRMARPMVKVIPDVFGDDAALLPYDELHETAAALSSSEAALVVLGEPTLDKAFDKAVTHASKTLKHVMNVTADELAKEMKEAANLNHLRQLCIHPERYGRDEVGTCVQVSGSVGRGTRN